jgi:hypothetical protein
MSNDLVSQFSTNLLMTVTRFLVIPKNVNSQCCCLVFSFLRQRIMSLRLPLISPRPIPNTVSAQKASPASPSHPVFTATPLSSATAAATAVVLLGLSKAADHSPPTAAVPPSPKEVGPLTIVGHILLSPSRVALHPWAVGARRLCPRTNLLPRGDLEERWRPGSCRRLNTETRVLRARCARLR